MENKPGKRNLVDTSSSDAHTVNDLVQLVKALVAGDRSRLPELLNYPQDMLDAVLQDRNLDIDGDGNVVTRDMNVGDESVVGSHNVIISIKEASPSVAAQLAGVSTTRRLLMVVFFLVIPLAIITGILIIFSHWHVPTNVQITLVSRRALFTIGKLARDSSIMHSVDFRSITIERFSNIILNNVEVFVPDQHAESTEQVVSRNIPVMEIRNQEEFLFPSVTIQTEQTASSGNVEGIRVRAGARLLMEFGDINTADNIIIQVHDQQSEGNPQNFFVHISLSGAFHLIGRSVYVSGIEALPTQKDFIRYKITKIRNPLEIISQPSSLFLTISPDKNTELFEKEYPLPISALDFTYLDDRESRLNTALVDDTEGYISYPDFPGIPARTFDASNFITIDPLDGFEIVEMALDTHHKGFRFLLEGMVKAIRTQSKKSSDKPKDYRLTRFDIVTHPNTILQWEIWCCIFVWGAMATVGWYVLSRMGHT